MEIKKRYIEEVLNKDIRKLKNYSVIINNDKPFFNEDDYKIIEGIPKYFEIDQYGRTSGAIAIISKYTLSIRTEKHLTYPNPNGWTSKIENSGIFQRCHCIAYRLSAKKNDEKNIFIGTTDLNKKIMSKVENTLEKYINSNSKKYIRILYRVTPQYKGKNQIPIGILLEAKSLDSDYSICRFCYNVKENVEFKYSDGTVIRGNIKFREAVQKIKRLYSKAKQKKIKNISVSINYQTKKYHNENCKKINEVDPKYIKEITTKENKLIEDGYVACKIYLNEKS